MRKTEQELGARRTAMPTKYGGANTEYSGVFNSFSGADIVAYIHMPPQDVNEEDSVDGQTKTAPVVGVLGNIQTISYSTFREVEPVRSLGKVYADAYTRGPRTIAGTIVWTVLDQHVLAQALGYASSDSITANTILVDQIPPFNIIITFNNEYGDVATMGIYGIRMVNEGATFSIDDMITEQTNSFIAEDIDMLHKGSPFRNESAIKAMTTGTDILLNEAKMKMAPHRSSLR